MIAIENTLISEDIIEKQFVCDLNKCKGSCCEAGDAGAPLEESELAILESIITKVVPYLTAKGLKAIQSQGLYVVDPNDGEYTTPLIDGNKECAYTIYEKGIAKCAIEKAYLDEKIDFKKPISCHLYPIRIKKYKTYEAVNYEKWSICSPACSLGKELRVPVYEFVKEALIRKYGQEWFTKLSYAADNYR
jgi:hypothetical protein